MRGGLLVGESRIGQLFDGQEDSPHLAAMISHDDDGVYVEVSYMDDPGNYHQHWFRDGQLPPDLLFVSIEGSVALAGCIFVGERRNLGSGLARGRIRPTAAVFGAGRAGYRQSDGMRSDIAGLARWTRRSLLESTLSYDPEQRISGLTVTAQSKPAISVDTDGTTSLLPYFSWAEDQANGQFAIQERILVQTSRDAPAPLKEHLRIHGALQDLVSLAYWWPCHIASLTVRREDDPERTLDGETHDAVWLPATIRGAGRRSPVEAPLPAQQLPLFTFDDIGRDGVARWLVDTAANARPFEALVTALFQAGTPIESRLLQVGAALEALGRTVAEETGRARPGVKDRSFTFPESLRLITEATACGLDAVRGDEPSIEAWAVAFNTAYKGVKHADNPMPRPAVARTMHDSGVLLMRLWLARHLGAAPADLEQRLAFVR